MRRIFVLGSISILFSAALKSSTHAKARMREGVCVEVGCVLFVTLLLVREARGWACSNAHWPMPFALSRAKFFVCLAPGTALVGRDKHCHDEVGEA